MRLNGYQFPKRPEASSGAQLQILMMRKNLMDSEKLKRTVQRPEQSVCPKKGLSVIIRYTNFGFYLGAVEAYQNFENNPSI